MPFFSGCADASIIKTCALQIAERPNASDAQTRFVLYILVVFVQLKLPLDVKGEKVDY